MADYLQDRFAPEPSEQIVRSEAERDCDRILYSTAFRRLDGVTQVASAGEVALFHNRLTHSLKVGQVGRKIAASLNFIASRREDVRTACEQFSGLKYNARREEVIDSWVLEAAGMAHDLGHPPFGHIAESALQKALGKQPNAGEALQVPAGYALDDTFEGNAQSLRIVTRLSFGRVTSSAEDEQGDPGPSGLNLTRATIAALIKYPWLRNTRPEGIDTLKEKWGSYDTEKAILDWATLGLQNADSPRIRPDGLPEYRSITAQAMDWADDITYAVHDVEDFCRAGLIPADLLRESNSRSRDSQQLIEGLYEYCKPRLLDNSLIASKLPSGEQAKERKFHEMFNEIIDGLPSASQATRFGRERFRAWSSLRIDTFTGPGKLGISVIPESGFIDLALKPLFQVELLKKLTWYFVIDRPALGSAQRGQARLIRELFVWLLDWVTADYHGPQFERASVARTDYTIAGMPPKLIDYLDVAYWQSSTEHGYRTDEERRARAVSDYISSLTEAQAVALHGRLSGVSTQSTLDAWFQV